MPDDSRQHPPLVKTNFVMGSSAVLGHESMNAETSCVREKSKVVFAALDKDDENRQRLQSLSRSTLLGQFFFLN